MTIANGTKGTFVNPSMPRMGKMHGHVEVDGDSSVLFIPDRKYNTKLFDLYDVEGEAGLFIEQGTFTPA
jgi:hypothetical protein